MKVLFAASECTPIAKVGGLGDVIGALPKALATQGVDVSLVLPYYKPIFDDILLKSQIDFISSFTIEFLGVEHECDLHVMNLPGTSIKIYLIYNQKYLSNGGIYLNPSAFAEGDEEPTRYMFFCKAVYVGLKQGLLNFDIIHCHDYHTSHLAYLVKKDLDRRVVLTIHNAGNQGILEGEELNKEIDGQTYSHNLLEIGIDNADVVVPVSPTYTKELLSGEFNFGLENVILRNRNKFVGIVNGIDTKYFDPGADNFLIDKYNLNSWKLGKSANKKKLIEVCDFGSEDNFVCGFVGRVVPQKNIELVRDTINELDDDRIKYVFLGVGDPYLESILKDLAYERRHQVYFVNKFDEEFSRLVFAGSDAFIIPSSFEPCGLTQLIAMRYGALPIARKTGGLADTIDDDVTGFLFERSIVKDFREQILKAYGIWSDDSVKWDKMVESAMSKDLSWTSSAKKYIELYSN